MVKDAIKLIVADEGEQTSVNLPGAGLLSFPVSGRTNDHDPYGLVFDASVTIRVPMDHEIGRVLRSDSTPVPLEFEPSATADIAGVDFIVKAGNRYAILELAGCTHDASQILTTSRSVRQACLRLLQDHGGTFGLIDWWDSLAYALLSDPRREFEIPNSVRVPLDVDGFVDFLLPTVTSLMEPNDHSSH
ncbi:MAG: hypothetical protein ACE15C_17560 [Phycisphaerae bacterium]